MFNKKEIQEVKEVIENNKKESDENLSLILKTLETNSTKVNNFQTEIKEDIQNIKQDQTESSKKLQKETNKIIELTNTFERSISSFENTKNRLDDMLYKRIEDLFETELNSLHNKMKEFSGIEEDFTKLVNEVNTLKDQIKKLNNISKEIKEVDFTLNKHINNIKEVDRKNQELHEQNEDLKSKMAKMIRNRR